MKLIVMAISEPGGRVSIRLCRQRSDNGAADCAPLPLTYGTLDVELTLGEMARLHCATGEALFERLRNVSVKQSE